MLKRSLLAKNDNVERVIQVIESRYCNMYGFDTLEAARAWCKLLQVFFRLRDYKEGDFKGHSLAEIMGYDVSKLERWVDFVLPLDANLATNDNTTIIAA